MTKRKSRKKWLYVAYKEQHPEIYGRQKKVDLIAMKRLWWKVSPIVVFVILNVMAIVMMVLLNTSIRAWMFQIF